MGTASTQLKYPVVLIHGLGARSTYGPVDYFYGIPQWLRSEGNPFLIAKLSSLHRIEHRSKQLRRQIESAFPNSKVNLIGHSMGGIDARYLAAQTDFSERVASVTTVGTPNRGTVLADHLVKLSSESILNKILKRRFREQNRPSWAGDLAAYAAAGLTELLDTDPSALEQLGTRYCQEKLPVLAPQIPGIAYFSATSAIRAPAVRNALPIFWLPHRLIEAQEGDNDGFVSVESAKWGEHLCTYTGDHYAQIGQLLGRSRGLDHFKFFEEIFTRLKREGM